MPGIETQHRLACKIEHHDQGAERERYNPNALFNVS